VDIEHFKIELERKYVAKTNGVQSYTVGGNIFTFVNGKETLQAVDNVKRVLILRNVESINLGCIEGIKSFNKEQLTELANQMLLRGYQIWENLNKALAELESLNPNAPDFEQLAKEIVDKF
jgi:hypothetical protein